MITRRKFIKISALGIGGISMGASALNLFGAHASSDGYAIQEFTRFPTYCEVCFWKCAGWTHVDKKGEIVKIIGNPIDTHSNGRFCPRGTGGVGMYHDTDRLQVPLIRVKDGEKETFREATWEEALDLIASKMKSVKAKYGPESFALLKHGAPGKQMEHLFKAYGSDTIGEPAYAQCRGPRETAFSMTFGSWVGSPEPTDIRDTKCLVLIGSHIGENMHNGQVQEMSDAIDNGATIITVDPRLSTAASKSKYWLAIKPATDLALLLSWIHVIINEGLYDKKYVEQYGYGLDELKAHVADMTPEWAYGITTIKPNIIRETAREMAHASPAVIVHPGRHVVWYGDDTQRGRAVAILNGLLGSWGRRGGFFFPEGLSIPKFPHPKYPEPNWSWETLGEKYPLAEMGITNEIIRASIPSEAKDGHLVKAWMVAGTNLIKSIPNKRLIEDAMNSIEFMVVVDTMPSDIAGYADVVLPECTYLERYDGIRSAPHRHPSIALRMPAVQPKYQTKPSWWMAKQLGERLGLHEYFNFKDYEEVLDWQLKKMGSSLDEMKKLGVKNFDRKEGPLYLTDGEPFEFNTNTGKIEFYSTELEAKGFDPMPKYTPHPEPPAGFYRLNYGRAPMHTFSRTVNNPNLNDLMDENVLWVNPRAAKIMDINNGQYVWLQNQDDVFSTFPIKVRLTERIRWDSVYMVHGFGQTNKSMSRTYGKGAADTEMITKIMTDPIMGGTGMRGNFVMLLTENPHTKKQKKEKKKEQAS